MKSYISLLLGAVVLSGCTSKPPPVDLSTTETVLVYPLLDMRKDKKHNLPGKLVRHPVDSQRMKENGVSIHYAYDHGIRPSMVYQDFKSGNTGKLRILPTAGENYVLVVFVKEYHDTTSENIAKTAAGVGMGVGSFLASGGTAYVYGYSFQKDYLLVDAFLVRVDIGKVIWEYSGRYQGGFAGFPVIVRKIEYRSKLWTYHCRPFG